MAQRNFSYAYNKYVNGDDEKDDSEGGNDE